jgi:hypothetical protein
MVACQIASPIKIAALSHLLLELVSDRLLLAFVNSESFIFSKTIVVPDLASCKLISRKALRISLTLVNMCDRFINGV